MGLVGGRPAYLQSLWGTDGSQQAPTRRLLLQGQRATPARDSEAGQTEGLGCAREGGSRQNQNL